MPTVKHICRPPDPAIHHIMGAVARKLTPREMLDLAGIGGPRRNRFLAPGDTWRCDDCGRRWIVTPAGWRRRFPRYLFMAYGKTWGPELLREWEKIRARVAGRPDRVD